MAGGGITERVLAVIKRGLRAREEKKERLRMAAKIMEGVTEVIMVEGGITRMATAATRR